MADPPDLSVEDPQGVYQAALDFYGELLAAQEQVDAAVVKAHEQLEEAKDLNRADLITKAQELEGEALDMAFRIREMKVETLGLLVAVIGSVVASISKVIQNIPSEDLDPAFKVSFNQINQRYTAIYAPYFGLDKGTKLVYPDIEKWGDFMWTLFHNLIEGPVLLWSSKECATKWIREGVPPCEGPDYLKAWELAANADLESAEYVNDLRNILKPVQNYFEEAGASLAAGIQGVVEGVLVPTVKGFAKGLLPLWYVAAAGGLLWFFSKKKIGKS